MMMILLMKKLYFFKKILMAELHRLKWCSDDVVDVLIHLYKYTLLYSAETLQY